jgi:hypothetical protein
MCCIFISNDQILFRCNNRVHGERWVVISTINPANGRYTQSSQATLAIELDYDREKRPCIITAHSEYHRARASTV